MGKILFTEEQIRKRAEELGEEIARDYEGEEVILLGTLKGSVVWMADLMKEIPLDVKIDFVSASSYGSATSTSGVVTITKDVDMDLFNKHVIIVEDIVDTGTTLNYLKEYLKERNPKDVKICTLLDKPARKLSGGMRKRLSVGCAMAGDPAVMLLDEPTSALDVVAKERLMNYFNDYVRGGGAIVLVTHDTPELANCTRCYLLNEGTLSLCSDIDSRSLAQKLDRHEQ